MTYARLGGVLCALAIVMILIGTFGNRWVSISVGNNSGGLGLLELEACRGDECRSRDYGDRWSSDDELRLLAAKGAVVASLLLVVALGLAAYAANASSPIPLINRFAPFVPVLGGLAAVGALVAASLIKSRVTDGDPGAPWGIGWSAFVYSSGAAVGAVGAYLARRPGRVGA